MLNTLIRPITISIREKSLNALITELLIRRFCFVAPTVEHTFSTGWEPYSITGFTIFAWGVPWIAEETLQIFRNFYFHHFIRDLIISSQGSVVPSFDLSSHFFSFEMGMSGRYIPEIFGTVRNNSLFAGSILQIVPQFAADALRTVIVVLNIAISHCNFLAGVALP